MSHLIPDALIKKNKTRRKQKLVIIETDINIEETEEITKVEASAERSD